MISIIFNKKIEFSRLNYKYCSMARLILPYDTYNNKYYTILKQYPPGYWDFSISNYIITYNNVDKYKNMFLQIFLYKIKK